MIRFYKKKESLSTAGKWAFVIAMLMVLSFRSDYRLPIAGLLVHPCLVLLPFAYVFSGFAFKSIPSRISSSIFLFFIVFSLASLQNDKPESEIFKVGSTVALFLFFVFSVQTNKDFIWISWALLICALSIGIQGFFIGEQSESGEKISRLAGINVLEGLGNKNAQSLFTLPGLFFGSFLVIRVLGERKFLKLGVLVVMLFFIIISIFLSANRSGWLGMTIIFVSILYVSGLKSRTIFFASVVMVIGYLAINQYAGDIIERKKKQTTEGYSSDVGRRLLMVASFTVGFENPITGVGQDELHRQMALRLGVHQFGVKKMDTHFLPGYLFGATGLISISLFTFFLFRLTEKNLSLNSFELVKKARQMVIFFVILFVFRSFFSREILYSPSFIGGLGVIVGYYQFQLRQAVRKKTYG